MTKLKITPTQARQLAVTCQRLAGPQPSPDPAGIMDVFTDLGCVQIDPIRAVERTQFLVLWSRLGNYDIDHLNTLLFVDKQLFEYWAHAASIVRTDDYPIHRAYMRRFAEGRLNSKWYLRVREWMADNEPFRQHILEQLRKNGPLAASEIEDRTVRPWASDGWNNNRNVGQMISFMWEQGEIMVAERKGLQKKWTTTEQHLPDWTPREELSEREVVRLAAQTSLRALGVGTDRHVDNHFIRNRYPDLANVLADLQSEGTIIPVDVADSDTTWLGDWYIHVEDLQLLEQLGNGGWEPRTVLLSPFDNLICDRDRTELMWDFYFRIEIYVPKAKRKYGYYVLPILHGEQLIGRIDPRMDRKTGTLHVNAIYFEPDAPQGRAMGRSVNAAIEELGRFLGAKEIVYAGEVT